MGTPSVGSNRNLAVTNTLSNMLLNVFIYIIFNIQVFTDYFVTLSKNCFNCLYIKIFGTLWYKTNGLFSGTKRVQNKSEVELGKN